MTSLASQRLVPLQFKYEGIIFLFIIYFYSQLAIFLFVSMRVLLFRKKQKVVLFSCCLNSLCLFLSCSDCLVLILIFIRAALFFKLSDSEWHRAAKSDQWRHLFCGGELLGHATCYCQLERFVYMCVHSLIY